MKTINYNHKFEPHGELEYCSRCMGIEGTMTDDCSGEPLTSEQQEAVYAGYLDFKRKSGWTNTLSMMGINRVQSHFYLVTLKLSRHEGKEIDDLYKEFPESVHPEIKKLIKQLTALEDDKNKIQ